MLGNGHGGLYKAPKMEERRKQKAKRREITSDQINCLYTVHEKLHCILHFEHSRNQRQGSELFFREVDFVTWFPIACFTNGIYIVTHINFRLNVDRHAPVVNKG